MLTKINSSHAPKQVTNAIATLYRQGKIADKIDLHTDALTRTISAIGAPAKKKLSDTSPKTAQDFKPFIDMVKFVIDVIPPGKIYLIIGLFLQNLVFQDFSLKLLKKEKKNSPIISMKVEYLLLMHQ